MPEGPLLLVESDPQERSFLARALGRSGYDVQAKIHPSDVLEPVPIRLLITHLHFYDAQGDRDYSTAAEFCRRVQGWPGAPVPIIGLTSLPVDEDFRRFLAEYRFPTEGLYPFDIDFNSPSRLVELVREILGQPPSPPGEQPPLEVVSEEKAEHLLRRG